MLLLAPAAAGYVERKNITIDVRWAEGSTERLPLLAKELARLPVPGTKFDMAIDLGSTKALGPTIPPSLLPRADQVIE